MKKLQKLFAILLTLSVMMSLLGVTAFAADKTSADQIVENGEKIYYLANGGEASADNFDVWTSKTSAGTENEDEFEVTLQVGTTMKAIPNDVAVVLVMDASGSMMMDKNGYKWGRNGELPTDGRMLRIDYAREAALVFAEQLAENSGGAQRMLSVVEFGNNAKTVLGWTNANDNGSLNEDVAEAINSVEVNFVVDNCSFWDPTLMETFTLTPDKGVSYKQAKVDNWSDEEYTHETKGFFESAFESRYQSFVTEYTSQMVTEEIEETEVTEGPDGTEVTEVTKVKVTYCNYPDCDVEESHTHCSYEGCTNPDTHTHCAYAACEIKTSHTHCAFEGCQSVVADHKHCTVCGVIDAEKPDDVHCTFDGCTAEEAHAHCTYSICANPAGHTHCERRYLCVVDHDHCWDIQAVCGRTDEHQHVIGCTADFCQNTTPYHQHACVHGGVRGKYAFPDWNTMYDHSATVRCLNPDPNHTHEDYDADSYHFRFDRIHQKCVDCCTNLEGGLMLARNLVNTGLAKGGAIEGIDDVYVILLGDGVPTFYVDQDSMENPDTEVNVIYGEMGGINKANWTDMVDIVINDVGEGEVDVAVAEDIKDVAEFYAILYGTDMNDKMGGSHELSGLTGAEWFKGTGKNYVGADEVYESPAVDELDTVFAQIKDRIDVLAKAWTVTDMLSEDVTFGNFTLNGNYAGYTPASGDADASVSWSLGRMTPESGNGTMADPYIYTMKYTVTLNSAQDDVKAASLAHDADSTLDGVWTSNDTTLQYFMITKEELSAMTPAEIKELLRSAAFDDVSVKGIYGGLTFVKKNGETGEVMSGVGFTLYDSEGKAYGEEVFSDAEGVVTFSDIPRGAYTLKETSIPEGMQEMAGLELQESWGEVKCANGSDVPAEILNYPVGVEIPGGDDGNNPGGNGGSNDGGEGGSTVEPSTPGTPSGSTGGSDTTIEDEDTPLTGLPTEDAETSDEDVPLTSLPEEEVPLANVPKTSDASTLWLALSALSGTGLAGVSILGRKKREEI